VPGTCKEKLALNKPLPPEVQRRLRALYSYVMAMESGDLENIANLLRAAEQDAILDRMFQEIDMHYQDQMVVQPDELEAVHEQGTQLFMQELERVQTQQNGNQKRTRQIKNVFKLAQERVQVTMKYRPIPFMDEIEIDDMPRVQQSDQKSRRKRPTHFLQMVAAALLVGALLASFLLLFASRSQNHHSQVASNLTPQVQPPGMFIAVSSTAKANNPVKTFEAHGLHAANNTPSWNTFLMSSDATTDTVVTQNQIAYIQIGNDIFALQTDSGKVLWKKSLSFSPYSNITLQVKEDVLIAGGPNTNGFATLYRLNEQDGSVLWYYQAGLSTAFAIGNGVIYTSKDEVTSMFTSDPGALRSLVALNATNGHVIWSHNNIAPLGITVHNGLLYVQSMAADNTGSDKRYFLSLWTSSGDQLWSKAGPAQEPVPVAFYSDLFVIDTGSDLCAYRTDNEQQVWCTHTTSHSGKTIAEGPGYASYVTQNGVLYATYTMQTSSTSTHGSSASFLQALNIQTGTVTWTKKVGTSDYDISHKGSQSIVDQSQIVGLKISPYSSILLSQDTLSIIGDTSIYTFSLADGQQLWQSTIKLAGDEVGLIGLAYSAPTRP
jgi:outer membrane protein assembly factor BamB